MKKIKIFAAVAGMSLAIAGGFFMQGSKTDSNLLLQNVEVLAAAENLKGTCSNDGDCKMKCLNCDTVYSSSSTSTGMASYESGTCCNDTSFASW